MLNPQQPWYWPCSVLHMRRLMHLGLNKHCHSLQYFQKYFPQSCMVWCKFLWPILFEIRLAINHILLSTLASLANGLLNEALRLVNELSSLADTCSLWSVSKVQHWRPAVYILYKMACFKGVYLKKCETNSAGISIWHKNRGLLYWYKILRWYDEKLLCCRWVKIREFTKNKQGVGQRFQLRARVPSTAVPGWVDKRMA